jgi:hypothetical protein
MCFCKDTIDSLLCDDAVAVGVHDFGVVADDDVRPEDQIAADDHLVEIVSLAVKCVV